MGGRAGPRAGQTFPWTLALSSSLTRIQNRRGHIIFCGGAPHSYNFSIGDAHNLRAPDRQEVLELVLDVVVLKIEGVLETNKTK